MTAVETLKAEALSAGGMPCLRCDQGWYGYVECNDQLVCTICGYVEYAQEHRDLIQHILDYQERQRANFKFYIKGQKDGKPFSSRTYINAR